MDKMTVEKFNRLNAQPKQWTICPACKTSFTYLRVGDKCTVCGKKVIRCK